MATERRTIDLAPAVIRRLRDCLTRAAAFAEAASPRLDMYGQRTATDLRAECEGHTALLAGLLTPTGRRIAEIIRDLDGTVPLEGDGLGPLDVEWTSS
jgi:hypothetical protein